MLFTSFSRIIVTHVVAVITARIEMLLLLLLMLLLQLLREMLKRCVVMVKRLKGTEVRRQRKAAKPTLQGCGNCSRMTVQVLSRCGTKSGRTADCVMAVGGEDVGDHEA